MSHLFPSFSFPPPAHTTLILDIGTSELRIGYPGESLPRHISTYNTPVYKLFTHHIPSPNPAPCSAYLLHREIIRAIEENLGCDQRGKKRVIICENTLASMEWKEMVANIVFKCFKVRDVYPYHRNGHQVQGQCKDKGLDEATITFIPSPPLILLTHKLMHGIIVDIGHHETVMTPVYDGRPMIRYTRAIRIPADTIRSDEQGWAAVLNNQEGGLLIIIAETLLSVPQDLRNALIHGLLVSGRCAAGKTQSLRTDLWKLIDLDEAYRSLRMLRRDRVELQDLDTGLLPWLGGSLAASLELLSFRGEFNKEEPIPDWSQLYPVLKPDPATLNTPKRINTQALRAMLKLSA